MALVINGCIRHRYCILEAVCLSSYVWLSDTMHLPPDLLEDCSSQIMLRFCIDLAVLC